LRSDSYVRMQHFVRRSTYVPFRRFLGDVRREFIQLFMALWVPFSATLFRRAVMTLWRAFMFLGLKFLIPSFLLFAWWPPLLFLVRNYVKYKC
jgi:hypothetical protein